ncbi:universal stress protein [Nesterenkonia halobia]|uniref:Universal stress protein n=1 Tax=Nesterenkonia halobia TaxID=37922 RepID=A0ABP6REC8_9MICC
MTHDASPRPAPPAGPQPEPRSDAPLRRIAVGFGGDERSRDAVRLGAALARAAGARLDIVLIVTQDDPFTAVYPPVGSISGIVADQGAAWLREAEEMVPADVDLTALVRRGASVAEGLIAAAEERGADLLVTGSGVGAGRITAHPAVEALVHSSPIPLALAPAGYTGTDGVTDVFAAVSGTSGRHQVVDAATDWADQLDAELVHVTLRAGESAPHPDAGAETGADTGTEADAAEQTPRAVVAVGRTLAQAVRRVDWPQGALLLMGSSRLAGRRRLFLGTVAARILSRLPIPMIVMPRHEHETDQTLETDHTAHAPGDAVTAPPAGTAR